MCFIAPAFLLLLAVQIHAQDFTKFISKGDPKAKGINFTINYPSSWKPLSADRPNIVAKIFSENGKGTESVIVLIKKLPSVPGSSELRVLRQTASSPEYLRSLSGQNKFISGSSKTVIDGLPASTIIYSSVNRTLDIEVSGINVVYMVYYKDYFVTLMFSAYGQEVTEMVKKLESVKASAANMALSFVLLNKYE